jgi:hypothetical protein
MVDGLKRIAEEMILAQSRYYPCICLEGLGRFKITPVRRASVLA